MLAFENLSGSKSESAMVVVVPLTKPVRWFEDELKSTMPEVAEKSTQTGDTGLATRTSLTTSVSKAGRVPKLFAVAH